MPELVRGRDSFKLQGEELRSESVEEAKRDVALVRRSVIEEMCLEQRLFQGRKDREQFCRHQLDTRIDGPSKRKSKSVHMLPVAITETHGRLVTQFLK